ncbi:MAG: hypothetical protein AVDCRST_MAG06-1393 [uncultured Nocardioides sp.]|uniref:Uncharacterized protein n=1 Tax=uncultured Nocardioides sp. TaxID=198441 RepID=A0A6J4NK13_9ACTN|nr:MAG: hypothetical protein AVDCRST_MAG06-1393 [uncultured Nocardioides sp.]
MSRRARLWPHFNTTYVNSGVTRLMVGSTGAAGGDLPVRWCGGCSAGVVRREMAAWRALGSRS